MSSPYLKERTLETHYFGFTHLPNKDEPTPRSSMLSGG